MKHKLKIAPTDAPPTTHVGFACANCVVELQVERSLMELLLTNPSEVPTSPFIIWGECKGL